MLFIYYIPHRFAACRVWGGRWRRLSANPACRAIIDPLCLCSPLARPWDPLLWRRVQMSLTRRKTALHGCCRSNSPTLCAVKTFFFFFLGGRRLLLFFPATPVLSGCALLVFVGVLHPSNIEIVIRTGTDLQQCTFIATFYCCPTGRPGYRHHDLISHSATLSWSWAIS